MKSIAIELILDHDVGGFTARIPDIPAYGEGETKAEAIADLKEAIAAYVSSFGMEVALARINTPAELRHIRGNLKEFSLAL